MYKCHHSIPRLTPYVLSVTQSSHRLALSDGLKGEDDGRAQTQLSQLKSLPAAPVFGVSVSGSPPHGSIQRAAHQEA